MALTCKAARAGAKLKLFTLESCTATYTAWTVCISAQNGFSSMPVTSEENSLQHMWILWKFYTKWLSYSKRYVNIPTFCRRYIFTCRPFILFGVFALFAPFCSPFFLSVRTFFIYLIFAYFALIGYKWKVLYPFAQVYATMLTILNFTPKLKLNLRPDEKMESMGHLGEDTNFQVATIS